MRRTLPVNLYVGDKVQATIHIHGTTIQAGTVGVVTAQKPDKHGQLCTYIRFEGQTEDVHFMVTTTSPAFRKLPKGASPVSPPPAPEPKLPGEAGKNFGKMGLRFAFGGALICAVNGWDVVFGFIMWGLLGMAIGWIMDVFSDS